MLGNSTTSKWLKRIAITVAGLMVVFHVAGGYVFSNMIRSDALEPAPPTPDNGVIVTALGDGAITITSVEARSDTTQPGRYGLAYDGGYGQIGKVLAIDGLSVKREFVVMNGQPPAVCGGEPTDCAEVDIEGWAFESDPGDVGLSFEAVSYDAPLGPTSAWQVDSGDGTVWAIHVHGWRASKREAIRTLPLFADAGITSLAIDYRNDPNAMALRKSSSWATALVQH